MIRDRVFQVDGLLMALLPALGPRAALGPPRAVLKWAGRQSLEVRRSTLEFVDAAGRVVDRREAAFGLTPGTRIEAPYSRALSDDQDPPGLAETQRWHLNEHTVTAVAREPEFVWPNLVLTCLPLQVPLADDVHLIAGLVNIAQAPLDIARGMNEALCWVDGVALLSVAGGVWNGPYLVRPGHTATRRFRLADFPGAPVSGTHEVALEMLGRRSPSQCVHWHGVPWRPEATS